MKKKEIVACILAVWTVCVCLLFGFQVMAEDVVTLIKTNVPSEHTVSVDVEKVGISYEADGNVYTGSTQITVPRDGSLTLTFYPREEKQRLHLTCNGTNVTELMRENQYKIEHITEDMQLIVTEETSAESPKTGDERGIFLLVGVMACAVFIIYRFSKVKKCKCNSRDYEN